MGLTSLALLLALFVLFKLSCNGKQNCPLRLLYATNTDDLLFFSAHASPWSIVHGNEAVVENKVLLNDDAAALKMASSFNNVNAGEVNSRVCQTEACRQAGKALFDSINFTVNPVSKQTNKTAVVKNCNATISHAFQCNDFFEFSCGNWNAKHPIPDDKSRVGTFNMLDDTLTENMRQLLETPAETKASEAKSVIFSLDLYKECLDRDTIEKLGHQPIQQQLASLLDISWPIVNPDDFEQREADTNFMGTFLKFYSIGFAPVITFVVQPDANHTTSRRIYVRYKVHFLFTFLT